MTKSNVAGAPSPLVLYLSTFLIAVCGGILMVGDIILHDRRGEE